MKVIKINFFKEKDAEDLFFCYNIIVSRKRVQEIVGLNIKGVLYVSK